MNTTYLIWKDPSCGGVKPDWKEVNGTEFLKLVRSPENKGRYFIKLHSVDGGDAGQTVVIEATKENYISWKSEKNRAAYLKRISKGITVLSYHELKSGDDVYNGEELIRDDSCDVEAENLALLMIEEIRAAVSRLNLTEQALLEYLYLSDEKGTERGYSSLTGIPQKTINDRKKRALKKLLKFIS